MPEFRNPATGEYQDVIRTVFDPLPEYPIPEWGRTAFMMQSGDVLISAGMVGMGTRRFADRASEEQVRCILWPDHLYLPIGWIARVKPQIAGWCALLERESRNSLEDGSLKYEL